MSPAAPQAPDAWGGVVLRAAVDDDAAAVAAHAQAAYRGVSAMRGWTHEAHLILSGERIAPAAVRELIAQSRSVVLLAHVGAVLVGCVHVQASDGIAKLGLLAVDPGRQAAGLGRGLVAAAEALARDRFGAVAMRMEVIHSRVELISWYARLGYRPTGETAPFPIASAALGLPAEADLHFVVLSRSLAAGLAGGATGEREPR